MLTSLPQPLVGVPSFLFVEAFTPLLPLGLGFAAGAMAYVACFELIPDATKEAGAALAAATAVGSFGIMTLVQWEIYDVI